IRKEFTSAENDLDIKKDGSVPFIIQNHRNQYVKKIEAEKEKQRLEAQRKLDEDKERIEIRTEIESQLSNYLRDHITERKNKLQLTFNDINLDNFMVKEKSLKELAPVYHKAHFIDFVPNISPKLITLDEVALLTNEVTEKQDFNLVAAVVENELKNFINDLIEKLPSLKAELVRMQEANAEEKKKIEAERKKREADEQKKIQEDAAAEKLKKE